MKQKVERKKTRVKAASAKLPCRQFEGSWVGRILQCLGNYWGVDVHREVDQLFGWDYKAGVVGNSSESRLYRLRQQHVHDGTLQQGWLKLLPNVWLTLEMSLSQWGWKRMRCWIEDRGKVPENVWSDLDVSEQQRLLNCRWRREMTSEVVLKANGADLYNIKASCSNMTFCCVYVGCLTVTDSVHTSPSELWRCRNQYQVIVFLKTELTYTVRHKGFMLAVAPPKTNVLHLWRCATLSKGAKEVNASGKTFTVRSSLQLHVDRNDDGVAYTCKVDHVALTQTPQQATEVLEVHCECTNTLDSTLTVNFRIIWLFLASHYIYGTNFLFIILLYWNIINLITFLSYISSTFVSRWHFKRIMFQTVLIFHKPN